MRSYQHLCLIPLLAGLCACQPETTTQAASTATADKATTTIVSASAVAAPTEIISAVAPIAPSKPAPAEPVTAKTSSINGINKKVTASAVPAPKVAAQKTVAVASAAPAIAKIEPAVTPAAIAKPEIKVDAALSEADALLLAKKSGCLTCHAIDKKVVGPAWKDIAAKYRGDTGAQSRLSSKVAKGGSGAWGSMAMPANSPRVADTDIQSLVRFILLLK